MNFALVNTKGVTVAVLLSRSHGNDWVKYAPTWTVRPATTEECQTIVTNPDSCGIISERAGGIIGYAISENIAWDAVLPVLKLRRYDVLHDLTEENLGDMRRSLT